MIYYCDSCEVHSFVATPRYKVKAEVEDHIGTAIFVLFERGVAYLFKKTCAELFMENMRSPQAVRTNFYPTKFAELIGKKLLFKIETKVVSSNGYLGTFRVKRVLDDDVMLSMFSLSGYELSPSEALITPKNISGVSLGDGGIVESSIINGSEDINILTDANIVKNANKGDVKGKSIAMVTTSMPLTPTKRNLEEEFDEVDSPPMNALCKAPKVEN